MSFGKFKLTGLVQAVGQEQKFASGFAKRQLVVVDDPDRDYPNYAVVDFFKADCAKLSGLAQGDKVEVEFSPSGNESKKEPGRWYCGIRGISVTKLGASRVPANASAPTPVPAMAAAVVEHDSYGNDMPF